MARTTLPRPPIEIVKDNLFKDWLNRLYRRVETDGQIKWSQIDTSTSLGAAIASVSTADAATQTGAYVQADVQTIATLANANKTALNNLITELQNQGVIQ